MDHVTEDEGALLGLEIGPRLGPFDNPCGVSARTAEVLSMKEAPDGMERAIYEFLQNICDHMKELGYVEVLYKDGAARRWDGKTALGEADQIETISFVDDGSGVNPDHFIAYEHDQRHVSGRTLGMHGRGMKIASAYLLAHAGLSISVKAFNKGKTWEGHLSNRPTDHGGLDSLMHVSGNWREKSESDPRGTRIELRKITPAFVEALEKMSQTFLYANPTYPHAKIVQKNLPGGLNLPENPIEEGKVECLIGEIEGGNLFSIVEGIEVMESDLDQKRPIRTVHVDGLLLRSRREALLPWAISGLGETSNWYRQVKRSHDSLEVEGGGLEYAVASAVRSLENPRLLRFLIMKGLESTGACLEFPKQIKGDPPLSAASRNIVQGIFEELYPGRVITRSKAQQDRADHLYIENEGFYYYLVAAGVSESKLQAKSVLEEHQTKTVPFAKEPNAFDQMMIRLARVDNAICQIIEHRGRGALHVSLPGLIDSTDILRGEDLDGNIQHLAVAAIIAFKKRIPIEIKCYTPEQEIRIEATVDHYGGDRYQIKWKVLFFDRLPEDQTADKFSQNRIHLLFGGREIDALFAAQNISNWVPEPEEPPKEPELRGTERMWQLFQRIAEEVRRRAGRAGSGFGHFKITGGSVEGGSYSDRGGWGIPSSTTPWCLGPVGEGAAGSTREFLSPGPKKGPRLKHGIDLDTSLLPIGFFRIGYFPKEEFKERRIHWLATNFEPEVVSISSGIPEDSEGKIVLHAPSAQVVLLPTRRGDEIIGLTTDPSIRVKVLRDKKTGMYYADLRGNKTKLSTLTYAIAASKVPLKEDRPTLDDQKDILNYSRLNQYWKTEIARLREIPDLTERAQAVQRVFGEHFRYEDNTEINGVITADTLADAATNLLNACRGNCGHAASCAVLLYRACGIAARYIGGFGTDIFGIGMNHGKIDYWNGVKWVEQEPQEYVRQILYARPPSSEYVRLSQTRTTSKSLESLPPVQIIARQRTQNRGALFTALLAAGLVSVATWEVFIKQPLAGIMDEIAVQLKTDDPKEKAELDAIREKLRDLLQGEK